MAARREAGLLVRNGQAVSKCRCFSTSSIVASGPASPPRIDPRGRPKRDETRYGIPRFKTAAVDRETVEASAEHADHPLWKFFRDRQPIEDDIMGENGEGSRAWTANELRGKTFDELHELWYVLCIERNLLDTQYIEVRRHGSSQVAMTTLPHKRRQVKLSLSRVKIVLAERRRALMEAQALLNASSPIATQKDIKRDQKLAQFEERVRQKYGEAAVQRAQEQRQFKLARYEAYLAEQQKKADAVEARKAQSNQRLPLSRESSFMEASA
ncbi:uncharacterized protein L969DRAFT_42989 [Mixia osmundae IAM 14324]|uniref:Large ribosomal subunit protein uL29m n=1 Tax=Mixia osmundae (strain CBS 9802 / IAM 14324 / JCM 22182 / KY 12970) TaxID=764103 RepID=G7DT62_MIXOS|nr:uncharacterized protein L969DRAFT_42989 [Mixia osmundae IAM 14324]KEI42725.1 hypothetical protein L969DRAFT_42989 [Mixia osmundae IAM 14324]GAA93941.1 hypothetical protein E5Q_00587 [Mixia osmundae IAM 14324]